VAQRTPSGASPLRIQAPPIGFGRVRQLASQSLTQPNAELDGSAAAADGEFANHLAIIIAGHFLMKGARNKQMLKTSIARVQHTGGREATRRRSPPTRALR
jgi:hypothetical protein